MRPQPLLAAVRTIAVLVVLTGAAIFLPTSAAAHENHAPLPTKGVTIAGDTIMLSDTAREAIGLTTEKVQFGELHRTVEVDARVELPWRQQAMITSLAAGKIEQVLVRPGEIVTPDQELARVRSADMESLQLTLLRIGAEVRLARKLVAQRTTLDDQGVIAGRDLIQSQATLAAKLAEREITRQKLFALGLDAEAIGRIEAAGQPLAYVSITSPIGGVITHADVRIGQVVQPSDHLYHVVDPSQLWIVGEVLESDVRHLSKGQQVKAVFTAQPDRTFVGQIDHVRLKMNRRTRTQAVIITVDNRNGRLRPGMFGRVRVSVRVAKEAIVCPSDAVIENRTGRYVLVQRMPGKYENRRVTLGLEQNGMVEVLDGAFPGDQVVVVGSVLLASLLGNEHKARVKDDAAEQRPPDQDIPAIAVADASVELPTDQQAFAASRVEGRIRRVLIEPSQRVEAGQVLAEIDSLQVRNAQLELLQTLTRSRLASGAVRRLSNGAMPGQSSGGALTSQRRLWELQNQVETLGLQAESLRRQLGFFGLSQQEIALLDQADLPDGRAADALRPAVSIRAPAAGWIAGFHVVPGQIVHPEDVLFEIHDLSKVWVKGYLFERHASQVELGQGARVTFAAFPDLEATGRIVRIAPTMEESERVLPVWVEVANPDRLLKEGMFARVTVLPPEAGEQAEGGVAQLRPVKSVD